MLNVAITGRRSAEAQLNQATITQPAGLARARCDHAGALDNWITPSATADYYGRGRGAIGNITGKTWRPEAVQLPKTRSRRSVIRTLPDMSLLLMHLVEHRIDMLQSCYQCGAQLVGGFDERAADL